MTTECSLDLHIFNKNCPRIEKKKAPIRKIEMANSS